MEPGAPYTVADLAAAALAPGIPEGLMANRGDAALPPVLGWLDGRITDFFGFEVHLGRPEREVDALVCIKAETGGREILAAAIAHAGPETWWTDLRSFVSAWSDPLTPWASRIANIWLEFDVVAPMRPQPPPSMFFGAVRLIGADEPTALPGLLEASGILRGAALRPGAQAIVRRVFAALPAAAAIFQIGQMMARPDAPLRLCVRDIALCDIGPCLSRLGFAARRRELDRLLGRLEKLPGVVELDLDVGDALGPRIGLEWSPSREPAAFLRAQQAMFDWLVREGICRPDKAQAVQRWLAIAHCRRHQGIWPASLFAGDGAPERRATSCIIRYLHHVKIVSTPEGELEAKAYLACLHRFVPDRVFKEVLRDASARQGAYDGPLGV